MLLLLLVLVFFFSIRQIGAYGLISERGEVASLGSVINGLFVDES